MVIFAGGGGHGRETGPSGWGAGGRGGSGHGRETGPSGWGGAGGGGWGEAGFGSWRWPPYNSGMELP